MHYRYEQLMYFFILGKEREWQNLIVLNLLHSRLLRPWGFLQREPGSCFWQIILQIWRQSLDLLCSEIQGAAEMLAAFFLTLDMYKSWIERRYSPPTRIWSPPTRSDCAICQAVFQIRKLQVVDPLHKLKSKKRFWNWKHFIKFY